MCKRFKGRVCSRFRGRATVLPGSWIYLQSVDFFLSRKLSVDGSRPKVEFCGFFCL